VKFDGFLPFILFCPLELEAVLPQPATVEGSILQEEEHPCRTENTEAQVEANESNSALKIQNIHRSRNARKRMEAKREERREQEMQEMDRAALKIQQAHRMRDAKKEVQKQKEYKKRVAGKHHSLLQSVLRFSMIFHFLKAATHCFR
jgi:hypothetical protein